MENNENMRRLVLRWFGPFLNGVIPRKHASGLYLIYVSSYPIYVSSSANIISAINKHLYLSPKTIVPMDVRGKEILQYAKMHQQPLIIKTALLYQDKQLVSPGEHIELYREAANAVAFCHGLPCNRYASFRYDFETTHFSCEGKFFPLKQEFIAVETKVEAEDE